MPLEVQYQILALMGVLLIPFFIGMSLWSGKQRASSGWDVLEQRYPQKDKFRGDWQINRPLRLAAIRGFHTVDIGSDSGYLYLRPTQHGDVLKKPVQIPWSAIIGASMAGNLVEFTVTANQSQRIVLSLDCAALSQVEQVTSMISFDRNRK